MSEKGTYSELRRNTLIIGISNIGCKAIAFILAPLYSFYLTTSQYGTMDLITTTVSLILPLYCLDIYEATFRFSSDAEYDKRKILTSSLIVCLPSLVLSIIIFVISLFIFHDSYLINYTILFVVFNTLISILSKYARGIGKMRVFAFTGIINSIVMLLTSLLFLIILKLELKGWLISFLFSQISTVIYLCIRCNIFHCVKREYIDKNYIRTFVMFCIPLIPTAAMWWVMNASDRYMILFFMSTSANGVYSVANKIPSLLSIFENVFYQAWQTTAISKMHDDDRNEFFSNVFNKYFCFLTIGVVGLLLIGRPLILMIFSIEYSSAWLCFSILVLSVLFHALAGNLGLLYSVFKNTKGAFYSTVIGAVTNIVLNLIFIPAFGLIGAAVTTLIGYVVTLIYRWFDVKKFVSLKLNYKQFLFYLSVIAIQLFLYYINTPISYGIRTIILLLILILNRELILKILKK